MEIKFIDTKEYSMLGYLNKMFYTETPCRVKTLR